MGIVLRNKDRSILIRAIGIFTITSGLLLVSCLTLWHIWPVSFARWPLFVMYILAIVGVGYFMAWYALSPLFKTNRLLDFLLKDTLHELNIPLSVIKANLQMLSLEEKEPKNIKRLERIALASDDLYQLYKEIDYYIKREIREELKEVFRVDEVVLSAVEKCKELANETPIELTLLHVEIFADKHGFAKVLTNLLSNALKYNREQRAIRIYQNEHQLVIKDQGVGMSESELFLVFDRYYQIDVSKEGFGIGLSIVKAYCDDFKIGMKINSQKGAGTEVVLDLSHLLIKKMI